LVRAEKQATEHWAGAQRCGRCGLSQNWLQAWQSISRGDFSGVEFLFSFFLSTTKTTIQIITSLPSNCTTLLAEPNVCRD
jgi:hypothetical protein